MSGAFFPIDFSAISFLVVDDQQFSRRIVRSILHGFGSREVYESANGGEAIDVARNAVPSIIITDLIMPATSGVTLINLLKAPTSPVRQIPVIVLSGYLTKTTALAITSADALLVKPVSPKALYEHIVRIVLRKDRNQAPASFLENQRRHARTPQKVTDHIEIAGKDSAQDMAFVE